MRMPGLRLEPSFSATAQFGGIDRDAGTHFKSSHRLTGFSDLIFRKSYRSPCIPSNGVNTPYHLRVIRPYVHFVMAIQRHDSDIWMIPI